MSGGPGQLLLATAAAVAGFVISGGSPIGAAIGFQLGMVAGGIIWPLDGGTQQGPRLADREIQSSTYGASIPLLYGSYRTAGNIIYSKAIEEKTDVRRVGKSLFSKGTKVYSYTYFGHFAVGVCEGPISSIGRIWADSKLIYDPETTGKYDQYIRRYLGTEDQLPDPAIQADKGIDNTPAFRGTAYVMFAGLPLADFGNRLPNISVEVGALAHAAVWTDGSLTNIAGSNWNYDPAQPNRVVDTWSDYVTVVDPRTLTAVQWQPGNYTVVSHYFNNDGTLVSETTHPIEDAATLAFGPIYGPITDSTQYTWASIDPASGDVIVFLQGVTSKSMVTRWTVTATGALLVWQRAFFTEIGVGDNYVFGTKIYMIDTFQKTTYCIDLATGAELWQHDHHLELSPSPSIYDPIVGVTYRASDGSVYLTWQGEASFDAGLGVAGGRIARQSLSTGAILTQAAGFLPADGPFSAIYDAATDKVIIIHDGGFIKLDPSTLAVSSSVTMATPWQTTGTQLRVEGSGNAVSGSLWLTDGNNTFWQLSTADFSTLWTGTTDPAIKTSLGGMGAPFHVVSTRPMFFGYSGGGQTYKFGNTSTSTTLAEIITDICGRCDLPADDIDVTELVSQGVTGYGVLRESTGRAALEPLLSAYSIDAPEVDGVLRFQRRRTALNATVTDDDLGSTGDTTEIIRVTERRRQEIELPERVTVTYASLALDYEANTQTAKRRDDTIKAGDPRSQEFPLVMADVDASTLASRLLYLAWIERSSYSFSLPPKWLIYDAGDVFDLPVEAGTVRVLLTKVEIGGDGIVRVEALATDDLAYLPAPDAPVVPIRPTITVPTIQDMQLVVLDAPLLSDSDDQFGFYVGGDGTALNWSGGAAYASQDATNYEFAAAVPVATPVGTAVTVLPSRTSALLDRVNVLRVSFGYAVTLTSITELELLAGGNLAMLGDELLGFATATPVSSGVYDLSLLRRGIQGTEWASSHIVGERFVLLDNIQSVDAPLTDLGQTEYWKAVSLGETLDDQTAEAIVGTGVRLRPLSPVHIVGERSGDDLAITWTRRARLDPEWRDLTETGLDEPTEAYQLDVLDGSTVKRTISTSSPTATYLGSEQTTDFGSPQTSIDVKIYQISSRVGRGYPGAATL